MLGQVVTHEHVEERGVSMQVGVGHSDQLAVPGRRRVAACSRQDTEVVGQEGGGHQERCRSGACCTPEDVVLGIGMFADEAVEEGGDFVGHTAQCAPTLTPR